MKSISIQDRKEIGSSVIRFIKEGHPHLSEHDVKKIIANLYSSMLKSDKPEVVVKEEKQVKPAKRINDIPVTCETVGKKEVKHGKKEI